MKQLRGYSFNSQPENKDQAAQSLMDEAMKKYGNMDEDALTTQLLNSVRTQKANGTYDEAQMLSFINMMSPHLSDEQRAKLETLISMISGEGE